MATECVGVEPAQQRVVAAVPWLVADPEAGTRLEDVRAAYRDQGTSIAALAREHGVSRVAGRTALADLLPEPKVSPDTR